MQLRQPTVPTGGNKLARSELSANWFYERSPTLWSRKLTIELKCAVVEATAQRPSDMLHDLFRIEQVAENSVSNKAHGDSQADEFRVRKLYKGKEAC